MLFFPQISPLLFLLLAFFLLVLVALFLGKKQKPNQEGMDTTADTTAINNEMQSIQQSLGSDHKVAIKQSMNSTIPDIFRFLPLQQFCIQAAYNAACSGQYVSDNMVALVLSRGCRFLDFEVYFNDDKSQSVVGMSSSNNLTDTVPTSTNTQTLSSLLQSTMDYAFIACSAYSILNHGDPLFIHFRLRCAEEDKSVLFSLVQTDLQALYNVAPYATYFFDEPVSPTRPIQHYLGKVLFGFEFSDEFSAVEDYCNGPTSGLFYNFLTGHGSKHFPTTPYSYMNPGEVMATPPKSSGANTVVFFPKEEEKEEEEEEEEEEFSYSSSSSSSSSVCNMLVPDTNLKSVPNNPNFMVVVPYYGYQICLMQYYNPDVMLKSAEQFYSVYSSGFVPVSYGIKYADTYGKKERGGGGVVTPSLFRP